MLWGWIRTWICSGFTEKSHFASITSRPLLTMLAESIVIFRPIAQFGCFRASSTRTFSSCCLVKPRKDGKTVFYSLADDHVRKIIAMGIEHIME